MQLTYGSLYLSIPYRRSLGSGWPLRDRLELTPVDMAGFGIEHKPTGIVQVYIDHRS